MALCRDEETNRKFRGAQRRGWVGVLGTGEGHLLVALGMLTQELQPRQPGDSVGRVRGCGGT